MKDNKKEFFKEFGNSARVLQIWAWIEAKLAEAKEEAEKEYDLKAKLFLSRPLTEKHYFDMLMKISEILDKLPEIQLKKDLKEYLNLNSKTN